MKKLLILFIYIFISLSVYAEKRLYIEFTPTDILDSKMNFIDEKGFSEYSDIINSLEKGKKVIFSSKVPKTGILEGTYKLLIYKDTECIGIYEIINNDYVYNEKKDCFQKIPYILDRIRSILFYEYLINNSPHI